jgi:LysR family transcriptional regulator, hydrogen peroxide-inducible genes activator
MAVWFVSAIDAAGVGMEMHRIRYFLALCEERSFTRAARQCGISQPSLTQAIIRLEQELGGALFERKPAIALTVLGHAVHPYFQRIAENANLARGTAQALVNVRLAVHGAMPVEQLVATPETPGRD